MFVGYCYDSSRLACLIPPIRFLWVWGMDFEFLHPLRSSIDLSRALAVLLNFSDPSDHITFNCAKIRITRDTRLSQKHKS